MEEVRVFWNLGISLEQTKRHTRLDERYVALGFYILGHNRQSSVERDGDSKAWGLRGDAEHHHVTR